MKRYYPFLFLLVFIVTLSCESNITKNTDSTTVGNTNVPKTSNEVEPDNTSKKTTAIDSVKASGFLYGIDISKFQGDEIKFLDKQTDNLSFIICKATEGITYTDPKFKYNWTLIPQKGFRRGAYHFYRTADDPTQQAKTFSRAIADLKATDLPPIVDFEEGGIDQSQSVEEIQANLLSFLKAMETNLKRKPMIYTDISSGNKYLNQTIFSGYPLWVAVYNNKKSPDLPRAWKSAGWKFWQKTSSYEMGHTKNDFDVFNGNLGDLHQFIKDN